MGVSKKTFDCIGDEVPLPPNFQCNCFLGKLKAYSIPVDISAYVVKHHLYRPFQFYILLKSQCNGQMRISSSDFDTYAHTLEMKCGKSLKLALKKLLKLNWVGYNPSSKTYFVRGFKKVRQLIGGYSRSATQFFTENLLELKAFVAASVMGYMVNCQKKKEYASGSIQGGLHHNAYEFSDSDFYPVANTAVAKIVGVAPSTAFELKKLAAKEKFIFVRKSFKKTLYRKEHSAGYKSVFPELAGRLRAKGSFLVIQDVDKLYCSLKFKTRK